MSYKEITGQPCSGKTQFLTNEVQSNSQAEVYHQGAFRKVLNFLDGIYYLGFRRTITIYKWSMLESASLLFRHNIFRNAVTKFGIYHFLYPLAKDNSKIHYIDEGISHLPYLFQNTSTKMIVEFLSSELKDIEIILIKSPAGNEIQNRLMNRGHKRLKFMSVETFVSRNMEIDRILRDLYPKLCKTMDVS
jgi:hypothetical protein